MTQMNLSMKQKQTHRHREHWWLPRGKSNREGMDWESGISRYKLYIYTHTHIYKTESLCYTWETNTILQINYTSIK